MPSFLGVFSLKLTQDIKKIMQNIPENTYYDTKRLILAKNVNQNETTAKFRAKNGIRLSFSSPLYGSTPVIQDRNMCPN